MRCLRFIIVAGKPFLFNAIQHWRFIIVAGKPLLFNNTIQHWRFIILAEEEWLFAVSNRFNLDIVRNLQSQTILSHKRSFKLILKMKSGWKFDNAQDQLTSFGEADESFLETSLSSKSVQRGVF